jgi:hypothetical protein
MKYTLMTSRNMGTSYEKAYETDDRNDPVLEKHLEFCNENYMRYYIIGDDGAICRQHKCILNIFGLSDKVNKEGRSIGENVELLKQKFSKRK